MKRQETQQKREKRHAPNRPEERQNVVHWHQAWRRPLPDELPPTKPCQPLQQAAFQPVQPPRLPAPAPEGRQNEPMHQAQPAQPTAWQPMVTQAERACPPPALPPSGRPNAVAARAPRLGRWPPALAPAPAAVHRLRLAPMATTCPLHARTDAERRFQPHPSARLRHRRAACPLSGRPSGPTLRPRPSPTGRQRLAGRPTTEQPMPGCPMTSPAPHVARPARHPWQQPARQPVRRPRNQDGLPPERPPAARPATPHPSGSPRGC